MHGFFHIAFQIKPVLSGRATELPIYTSWIDMWILLPLWHLSLKSGFWAVSSSCSSWLSPPVLKSCLRSKMGQGQLVPSILGLLCLEWSPHPKQEKGNCPQPSLPGTDLLQQRAEGSEGDWWPVRAGGRGSPISSAALHRVWQSHWAGGQERE